MSNGNVFPDDALNWPGDSSGFKVGGYQQLVRGEPFRGKFRRSFSNPVPFEPNVPDSIRFSMPDVREPPCACTTCPESSRGWRSV